MALTKADGSVAYACCQCPAGKVGTCSHVFVVMKLVAKWVIDKINKIPEPKACTSKPCAWSIPQSREGLEKSPVSSLKVFLPQPLNLKSILVVKVVLLTTLVIQIQAIRLVVIKASYHLFMMLGLRSNRKNGKRKLLEMHDVIYSHNKNIPLLSVIDLNQGKRINTSFGTMPVGSVLSNQCWLIPPDLNIYCNLPDPKNVIKHMCSILYFHLKRSMTDFLNTLLI